MFRPLAALAILALIAAAPAAAAPAPGKQVAALKRQVATLKAELAQARADATAADDRAGTASSLADDLGTKLATAQQGALGALETLNAQQIFRQIFPPLKDWLALNYFPAGSYSLYQSGRYLSFTFTCYSCG